MNCPICKKEYKGKIGVGVHLKRGHSLEERQKYRLGLILGLVPFLYAMGFIMSLVVQTQRELGYENS
jgi:hypothetical protein